MKINTKEWLGMQEAANYAKVTRATIHNWHKRGLIKAEDFTKPSGEYD